MSYNVLLTRPTEQNYELSKQIQNHNIIVDSVPLEKISAVKNISAVINDTMSNIDYDIIIFTSQNAIKLFAEYSKIRKIPIFVAGKASYDFAMSLGFEKIYIGDELGAKSILDKIIKDFYNKKFLYITGEPHFLDFKLELNKNNIFCNKIVIYTSLMDENAKNNIDALLENKSFDATLLFSGHAAKIFNNYILHDDNLEKFRTILVLSKKIAINITKLKSNSIIIFDDRIKMINFLMEQSNHDTKYSK
jgi:uroporphyrinogen-III synthase